MEILLVQMAIARGKPALNRAKVQALTAPLAGRRPPAGSPRLLVLPELFSTGFLDEAYAALAGPPGGDGEAWEEVSVRDRAFLAGLASATGCWVAGTTVEVEPVTAAPGPGEAPSGPRGEAPSGPRFRNVSLLFAPEGGEAGASIPRAEYRKVHPFSYGGEDKLFRGGREVVTLDLEGWVVQPTICYDLRFPELYRAGSSRGVHLILVQANWPEARQAHWETLLRARAIENQAYVAGVNCVGSQGTLRYAGGSQLVSPKGEVIAAGGDAEGLVRGAADLDLVRQWRRAFPALRDRMPPDFYRALP